MQIGNSTAADYLLTIDKNKTGTPLANVLHLKNSLGTNTPEALYQIENEAIHCLGLHGRSGAGNTDKLIQIWNLNTGYIGIGTVPANLLDIRKVSASYGDVTVNIAAYGSNAQPPYLALQKSRGADVNTFSATNDADYIGEMSFRGVNASNASCEIANVSAQQVGTAGATYNAGCYYFNFDGTSADAIRMTIDQNGIHTPFGIYAGADVNAANLTVTSQVNADFLTVTSQITTPSISGYGLTLNSSSDLTLESQSGNILIYGTTKFNGAISGLTAGKIPMADDYAGLANSLITQSGTNIGINTTPLYQLHVSTLNNSAAAECIAVENSTTTNLLGAAIVFRDRATSSGTVYPVSRILGHFGSTGFTYSQMAFQLASALNTWESPFVLTRTQINMERF